MPAGLDRENGRSSAVPWCSFNDEFDKLYYVQKELVIVNEDVRDEVRRELIKNLLPPYTDFWNRHVSRTEQIRERYGDSTDRPKLSLWFAELSC